MKRVGQEYPRPRVNDGWRKLWLRDDLDQATFGYTCGGSGGVAEGHFRRASAGRISRRSMASPPDAEAG
jgi:hypothetical protein